MNEQYIHALPTEDLAQRIYPFLIEAKIEVDVDRLLKITPEIRERITTLRDAIDATDFLFAESVSPDPMQLVGKGMTKEQTRDVLKRTAELLRAFEPFEPQPMEDAMRKLAEESGLKPGPFFTPIRVAVTGKTVSPPLFGSIVALGREATIERLKKAEELLAG
jgi:glutamyl-tRNA synthetase